MQFSEKPIYVKSLNLAVMKQIVMKRILWIEVAVFLLCISWVVMLMIFMS